MDFRTSDGVRLHVEITDVEPAATVVLVHGLASDVAQAWQATGVTERLADAGLRVVAYDARAHGRSDRPHDAARYGDARVVADLAEIVAAFGGPSPVVAGYSMGAATVLLALAGGMPARAAVVGAAPPAVLRWSPQDDATRAAGVAALEGTDVTPAMQWWIDYLESTGADRLALAAFLRGHRPVVEHWECITVRVVVAAGVDDTMAAPPDQLAARLPDATTLALPGNHLTAAHSAELSVAIVAAARADR